MEFRASSGGGCYYDSLRMAIADGLDIKIWINCGIIRGSRERGFYPISWPFVIDFLWRAVEFDNKQAIVAIIQELIEVKTIRREVRGQIQDTKEQLVIFRLLLDHGANEAAREVVKHHTNPDLYYTIEALTAMCGGLKKRKQILPMDLMRLLAVMLK